MKKFVVLILAVSMLVGAGVMSSFATCVHVSRDQVTNVDKSVEPTWKGELDLGSHGENDPETDLGDISKYELDEILIYGWAVCDIPIKSFGYRVDVDGKEGEEVLDVEKYYKDDADKELIDSQKIPLGAPDGEGVRFHIILPVQVGDVEITLFVIDEDDNVEEMDWKIYYENHYVPTSEPGGDEPSDTPDTPPADTPDDKPSNPGNTGTADTTALVFMMAAFVVVTTVLVKKRAF